MSRRSLVGRIVGALLVAAILVFAIVLLWPSGSAPRAVAAPSDAASLERGRYIAIAADCVACHTTENGPDYAGGREFRLPFGSIYAPNITPDRDTGIGAWTDGEFLRAMHDGVGRHGEPLYPAFPYTSYTKMSEADVLALKAYLFTLPAVRNEVPANALRFPFNQRRLMRFWNAMFKPDAGFERNESQSPEWNRGAYLATALGHCGECHTPRNFLYGHSGKALAGESIQGWTAWNITSDRAHGIGEWSVDDLVSYFASGYAPGRAAASGPMKEAIDYSLSKLTDEDRRALAVYLKTVPAVASGPVPNETRPLAARASDAQENALGKRIFEGACASCHAWEGEGRQSAIAALQGRRSVADPEGLNVIQTILRGGEIQTPREHAFMPAFAKAYSDAEIAATTNFVVSLFGNAQARVTPDQVAEARDD